MLADPTLHTRVQEILQALGDPEGWAEGHAAVRMAATEAVLGPGTTLVAPDGTEKERPVPLLFHSRWPVDWLPEQMQQQLRQSRHDESWESKSADAMEDFAPEPEHALAVIDGILNGRITDWR